MGYYSERKRWRSSLGSMKVWKEKITPPECRRSSRVQRGKQFVRLFSNRILSFDASETLSFLARNLLFEMLNKGWWWILLQKPSPFFYQEALSPECRTKSKETWLGDNRCTLGEPSLRNNRRCWRQTGMEEERKNEIGETKQRREDVEEETENEIGETKQGPDISMFSLLLAGSNFIQTRQMLL